MKLTRKSVAPAFVLGLCIGLVGACGPKKPAGTTPPGETASGGGGGGGSNAGSNGGGEAASDGGDEGSSDGGSGDAGSSGDPETCDAMVAETPTLLFGDQVIIRPPKGVDFALDDNPMVQQAMMSGGFVSACNATVKRMVITVYETDKKKKPAKLMDEFITSLESQGYKGGSKSGPYVDSATDYHISMEYGGGGGAPPTTLYLAVARRGDKDFVVVIESSPEEFGLLKPTMEESAKSLFVVPPDA